MSIFNNLKSQNLVLNPSFEDTIACSSYTGPPLLPCIPWYQNMSSSDYFSSSYTQGCGNSPLGTIGYQSPHSGNAYCGFGTFLSPIGYNYREFLGGRLSDTLKIGHLYKVSFYVSAANHCIYFTDKIGVCFFVDSNSTDSDFTFQYTPQIENATGNILNDTMNWVEVSGVFTALGGERYLSIGNFRDDNHTLIDSTSNAAGYEPFAYYYVDDVSVIDCTATGINEHQQISFTLLQNPVTNSIGFTSPQPIQTATVFTTVGALVKQVHFSNTINYSFDVADLPRGLYFLQVETKDKRKGIRKFVKQ
jgi:hypothetical protein